MLLYANENQSIVERCGQKQVIVETLQIEWTVMQISFVSCQILAFLKVKPILSSVRPKPNIRPKISAKSAEIFARKFRPTCRTFGQVTKREK